MVGSDRTAPGRDRPIRLLRRVVGGDGAAWKQLVETHYGFLFTLAKPYARGDRDLAAELVLVACEGLMRPGVDGRPFYRLRKYLDSVQQFGKRSRFSSWLAMVAKNLWRDWFRSREGRRVFPADLDGATPAVRLLYAALFWDGSSEQEAESVLRGRFPQLDEQAVREAFGALWAALSDRSLYRTYLDLMRRLPALPIAELGGAPGAVQVADPAVESRPDRVLERQDGAHAAQRLAGLLDRALDALPERTAQVLGLLVLRELSGEQVQRVMGFKSRQRVYDEMARARRLLGAHLRRAGVSAADVEAAIGLVDSVLEKNLTGRLPDR